MGSLIFGQKWIILRWFSNKRIFVHDSSRTWNARNVRASHLCGRLTYLASNPLSTKFFVSIIGFFSHFCLQTWPSIQTVFSGRVTQRSAWNGTTLMLVIHLLFRKLVFIFDSRRRFATTVLESITCQCVLIILKGSLCRRPFLLLWRQLTLLVASGVSTTRKSDQWICLVGQLLDDFGNLEQLGRINLNVAIFCWLLLDRAFH